MKGLFTILLFSIATRVLATPTANAGVDKLIYLTVTSSVTMTGSGTGTSISYLWTKISTDLTDNATITNTGLANTTITGLIQGTWYYKLTVTEGVLTATDTVIVRVDYAPPVTGTIVKNLATLIPSIYPYVNTRYLNSDSNYFYSGNQSTNILSRYFDGSHYFFYQRDRLAGQFIDQQQAKYYTTIEDGYPTSINNYARSEMSWNSQTFIIDTANTYVFEWKGYYPQDFSYLTPASNVTTILQIHGPDSFSPPFAFVMRSTDLLFYEQSEGGNGASLNVKVANLSDFRTSHTIRLTLREGKGYVGQDAFITIDIDGVNKYSRFSGTVGALATSMGDYPKFGTMYDYNRAIVDPANTTRHRRFSLVTEMFKITTISTCP